MAKSTGVKVLSTVNVKPSKLVRTEKFMGRSAPVSPEKIMQLAESMRTRGQEQPCQVRAIEGTDQLEVIFGNCRSRAGEAIVAGYELNGKPVAATPDFLIRCEVVECSDEDALVNNLVEQAQRNQCSAIDDALNHKRLREEMEMSDAAITRLYGYAHQSSVTQLKKLLDLPAFVQSAIHEGTATKAAGLMLLNAKDVVEAGAFQAVWDLAKTDGDDSNIGGSEMAAAIKAWRKSESERKEAEKTETAPTEGTEGTETTKPEGEGEVAPAPHVALTLKQVKTTLEMIANDPRTPPRTATIFSQLFDMASGKAEPKNVASWVMAELGEELLPEPVTGGTETPAEVPAETPATPAEVPAETPAEVPAETPAEVPAPKKGRKNRK